MYSIFLVGTPFALSNWFRRPRKLFEKYELKKSKASPRVLYYF